MLHDNLNLKTYLLKFSLQFVTRAVRVIDLITNIDMQGFQAHGGLNSFINRLEMEVNVCRKEQPFEAEQHQTSQTIDKAEASNSSSSEDKFDEATSASASEIPLREDAAGNLMEVAEDDNMSGKLEDKAEPSVEYPTAKSGKTCLPQRAALLKSMLNFLKKAIQDPSVTDSIRHVMEGSLPNSLKQIISNSEYYGPSLFLLATDVVTVYVFQEPSLLSSLQDNGLTDVVLHALLDKDVSFSLGKYFEQKIDFKTILDSCHKRSYRVPTECVQRTVLESTWTGEFHSTSTLREDLQGSAVARLPVGNETTTQRRSPGRHCFQSW